MKIINMYSQIEYLHEILQETIMVWQIYSNWLNKVIFFVENSDNKGQVINSIYSISQNNQASLYLKQN